MRVVAGQLTQPAHHLVSLGQVVVKSHHPVSTVQRPHQTKVLLPKISVVHSHWSRLNKVRLSLVKSFIALLASVSELWSFGSFGTQKAPY